MVLQLHYLLPVMSCAYLNKPTRQVEIARKTEGRWDDLVAVVSPASLRRTRTVFGEVVGFLSTEEETQCS